MPEEWLYRHNFSVYMLGSVKCMKDGCTVTILLFTVYARRCQRPEGWLYSHNSSVYVLGDVRGQKEDCTVTMMKPQAIYQPRSKCTLPRDSQALPLQSIISGMCVCVCVCVCVWWSTAVGCVHGCALDVCALKKDFFLFKRSTFGFTMCTYL